MRTALGYVEFAVAALLIGFMALVVFGVCGALVPYRWLKEERQRKAAEGDRWNS